MSSELRVKKLRGSGGYVVAALTDEQQTKASIGGPDLFLAPLCRMDTDRMSKHMCNMCDKEYEGPPEIHYENPNEEVAQGLTLVEKGRYFCKVCNSTIAEYREFRKEDEQAAGLTAEQPQSQEQQPSVAPTPPPAPSPSAPPPAPSPSAPPTTTAPQQQPLQSDVAEQQPQTQQQPQPAATPSDASGVSDINGRAVYDENATKIGIVNRIGIDSTNAMVLVITKDGGGEEAIPWSRVRKVGEIVLLGDGGPADAPVAAATADNSSRCGSCGFENREGSRFCEECGAKL
ncbi:MAG: PRC-barrel domain-containing protein [Thaumarchaeota archaeon]|nr:PRC-barrel domain-containing protein [Nitrososphaerota archaeon]